jgi:hypothetical protein
VNYRFDRHACALGYLLQGHGARAVAGVTVTPTHHDTPEYLEYVLENTFDIALRTMSLAICFLSSVAGLHSLPQYFFFRHDSHMGA